MTDDEGFLNETIVSRSVLSLLSTVEATTILLSNDVLTSVSPFLLCEDLFHLSLTCKHMTAAIEAVALQMIGSAKVRHGGSNNTLSTLEKMKLLLHSPIEFTDLVGKNLGYLHGDKACVYSCNPNELHTPDYIDENNNIEIIERWDGWEGKMCTAICSDYVMTSGRHYVKFTPHWDYEANRIRLENYFQAAVVSYLYSPIDCILFSEDLLEGTFAEHYRTDTDAWGEGDVHCCLYDDFEGTCEWTNWDSQEEGTHTDQRWDGMIGGSYVHDTRWRSGKSEKGAPKYPDNQRLPIDVHRRISTMMIIRSKALIHYIHH
ncbi:hypothetical protein QTG54_009038 [Skeletonema marinoi]|uniref:F-box domain-containing protein n=1 Tax=Skeletonema marinoi TaxID=267567 RepID=A0AAD8Y6H6_9STRA|nr:hypothetical protein QTG54_009038 [Skeletonema marinoi]